MNKKNKKTERILVVQPYGIGDTLFMLPFLSALRAQKNVERIDCIIGPRTRQIIENCRHVEDVFIIDKDKWKTQKKLNIFLEKCALLNSLRRRNYTILLDFSMQPEYSFWAKIYLRIPVRSGFSYKNRSKFLNYPLTLPIEGFKDKHVIEYYADLGKLIEVDIKNKKPFLDLPQAAYDAVRVRLSEKGYRNGGILVLTPGGGETWGQDAGKKQWPVSYFLELAEMIKSHYKISFVIIIGSKNEHVLGEYLRNNISISCANLCGETTLIESACAIKMSSLFIGNDGGLAHIAFSQNVPAVVIYGPVDQNVYGPLPEHENALGLSKKLPCQPCYKSFRYDKNCRNVSCLSKFDARTVFSRITAFHKPSF